MENPTTRLSLILRLRNRADSEAWDEFVEVYKPTIVRIALKLGLSDTDAEDASQEVLIRICNVVEQWDHQRVGATFRGWLYRVARNNFINFKKASFLRLARQVEVPNLDSLPALSQQELESCFDLEFSRQIFVLATQNIRNDFLSTNWSAFWMTYVDEIPIAEVAFELGIEKSRVYVARSRIVGRLRDEVERITSGDLSFLSSPGIQAKEGIGECFLRSQTEVQNDSN